MMERVEELLPNHYKAAYPRFILFLDKYYEWLYRSSGLSLSEISILREDVSWLTNDIDRFISTGQLRYINTQTESLDSGIDLLNSVSGPGSVSDSLMGKYTLESNDPRMSSPISDDDMLDGWFNSMGLGGIKRKGLDTGYELDQVLMLSLLKHMYAIKGTDASIRLFFNIFFNEEVIIDKPKLRIAIIDDTFTLDTDIVLRDDELYQEYSYTITLTEDASFYKELFDAIYIPLIHPSGFRVNMITRPSVIGAESYLSIGDDEYLLIEPGIYLNIYG